jgi:hypothetical protein
MGSMSNMGAIFIANHKRKQRLKFRKMNLRAYICGPVTGLDLNNEPMFREWEERLRELGYETVVPHDLEPNLDDEIKHHMSDDQWHEYVWRKYMNVCVPELCRSHIVVTLVGWENSRGATTEVNLARAIGIPVIHCHAVKSEFETMESEFGSRLINYR